MSLESQKKYKTRTLRQHKLSILLAAVLVVLYGWQLAEHLGPSTAAASMLQRASSSSSAGALLASFTASSTGSAAAAGALSLPASTLKYFPQAARCSTGWMQQYAQLQSDIQAGKSPPRFLVSVAVEAGLADRLAGLMTHFWHSVITGRALTSVAYGNVPSFSAMCDTPFIDWTNPPPQLPEEAVEPLKFTYMGERGYPGSKRFLPSHLDPETYQMLYLINGPSRNLTVYQRENISTLMNPDPVYLLAASNRGRSFALANNPYHKQQFWQYGVPPTDAFMCGFFFMCSPVAAIQQYYQKFWDVLQEPGVLRIGIQIRLGDGVFKQTQERPAQEVLKFGTEWFECAERLEKAYAAPGQKVLWYLNSDSQELRKAAKEVHGDKLVTDDELKMTHPDCHQDQPQGGSNSSSSSTAGPSPCEQAAMDEALQHSLGAMLTFSMTDYQVITGPSGFGRLGAWLSGQWSNIYQVTRGQGTCTAGKPVPPEQSAFTYSGV